MSDFAVKIVKLSNGADLIAKVPLAQDPSGAFLTVQTPMYLTLQQGPNGSGVTLVPFAIAANLDSVDIVGSHVLAMLEPDSRFASSYLAQLAGIVPATAGDVPRGGPGRPGEGRIRLVD